MLSLMSIIDSPKYELDESIDEFGRTTQIAGSCTYRNQLPFLIPLAVLNGALLLLTLIQAWKGRKLSTEFSESKHIFNILIITLVVIVLAGPVIMLSKQTASVLVFMTSVTNFIL